MKSMHFCFCQHSPMEKICGEMHRTIKQNSQRWERCALPKAAKNAVPPEEDVCIANSSLAGDRTGFQSSSFPDVMCGGMRQSDVSGLAVGADPWGCPHVQEQRSCSSPTQLHGLPPAPQGTAVLALPCCTLQTSLRCGSVLSSASNGCLDI